MGSAPCFEKPSPPSRKGDRLGLGWASRRQRTGRGYRVSAETACHLGCGLPSAYRKNQVAGFAEASVGAREGEESENSLRSQLVQQGRHQRVAVGGQAQRGLRVF